jgi:hypothetical protein
VALLAGGGATASVMVWRASRLASALGDWGQASVLTLALGVFGSLGSLVSAVRGTFIYTHDANGAPLTVMPGASLSINRWGDRLLILILILLAVRQLVRTRERTPIAGPAVVALLLYSVAAVSTFGAGDKLTGSGQISLFLALVCALFIERGRAACLGVGFFGVLTACSSGLLSLIHYNEIALPCQAGYKCGPLGVVFTGVLGNENGLGLVLALSVPFVWLGFRAPYRAWLTGYVVIMTIVTGSRTATIGAIGAAVLLALAQPGLSKRTAHLGRLLAILSVTGAAAVGYILPRLTLPPTAYTGRANLWQLAREHIAQQSAIGSGVAGWAKLGLLQGTYGSAASYSPHNQYLDVAYAAGSVGLLVFLVLIFKLLREARGATVTFLAVLLPVAITGITERPWSVGSTDFLTFAYLGAILAAGGSRQRMSCAVQASVHARAALPTGQPATSNRQRRRHSGASCDDVDAARAVVLSEAELQRVRGGGGEPVLRT